MKTTASLCLLASTFALAACSTVRTTTDYDRLTSFEKYKTYAWAAEPATQAAAGAVLDGQVRAAVEQELGTKGLQKAQGKRADIYAVYHFTGAETKGTKRYTDWAQPGSGFYQGWAVATQTDAALDRAKPGALVLDFVDARRRALVWRSLMPAVLAGPRGDDAVRTQSAVRAMLAGFPPK